MPRPPQAHPRSELLLDTLGKLADRGYRMFGSCLDCARRYDPKLGARNQPSQYYIDLGALIRRAGARLLHRRDAAGALSAVPEPAHRDKAFAAEERERPRGALRQRRQPPRMTDVRWIMTGSSRSVLLVGDFAVKIAKNKEGVLFNQREAERSSLDDRYCRVLGCYDGARVLVMERAEPIGDEESWRLKDSPEMEEFLDYDPARPIHVEANGRNIGRRHGRLVFIDYGDEP